MCLKNLNDHSWNKVTATQTRSFEILQTNSDQDVTTIEFHRDPRLSNEKYLRTSVDVSAVPFCPCPLSTPLSSYLLLSLTLLLTFPWQDPFPSSYYLYVLWLHPCSRHWHVTCNSLDNSFSVSVTAVHSLDLKMHVWLHCSRSSEAMTITRTDSDKRSSNMSEYFSTSYVHIKSSCCHASLWKIPPCVSLI